MNVKASKSINSTKLTLSDYNSQQMLPSNNNNKHKKFNSTGTADEGIEMKQQPIRPSSSLSSTSSTTSSFSSRPASRNSNYSPSKVLPSSSSSFFNMATSPCDSGIDSVGTSPCSDSGLKNSNASPFVEPAPPAPKDIPFNPIKNAMLGSSNNSLVNSSQTSHHHLPTDPRLKRITTTTSNRSMSSGIPLNNATNTLSSPLSSRSPRGSIFQSKNNITVNESSRTNNNKAQSSNCSPFRSPEPPTSINHTIQNANPVMTSTIAAAAHNNNQPILLKIPAFARSPQVRTHLRRVKQLTRMKRVLPRDPMFAADYFDGMIRKQARLDELSTSSDNQHTSST